MAKSKSQKSLDKWTKQDWTTPSGRPSKKKIDELKKTAAGRRKLAAATAKKRKATRSGKQYASHGLHSRKKK